MNYITLLNEKIDKVKRPGYLHYARRDPGFFIFCINKDKKVINISATQKKDVKNVTLNNTTNLKFLSCNILNKLLRKPFVNALRPRVKENCWDRGNDTVLWRPQHVTTV